MGEYEAMAATIPKPDRDDSTTKICDSPLRGDVTMSKYVAPTVVAASAAALGFNG
jgi:hypothetical protein